MIILNNIYHTQEPKENGETFVTVFQNNSLKIESIRSWLKAPGEVYNQEQDEWVLLVRGEASLQISEQILKMTEGDCCFIPRHTKHQVLSTSNDALWLGVFSF